MHPDDPPPRDDDAPRAGSARGQLGGRTEASKESTPGPALPHERDESEGSQAAPPSPQADIGRRAFDDATSERKDTDRRPVNNPTYGRQQERDPPRR